MSGCRLCKHFEGQLRESYVEELTEYLEAWRSVPGQARSPRPDPKGLLSRQVSPHLRTTLRGGYPRPCEAGCCPLGRPDGRTNSPMTARMTFLAAENRI